MEFYNVDVSKLSKLKHIYCFYNVNADNPANVSKEKFPIVYINHAFVYFKRPGNDALDRLTLKRFLDNDEHVIFDKDLWTPHYYVLCPVDTDVQVIFDKFKPVLHAYLEEKNKADNQQKYDKMKKDLQKTIKNMRDFAEAHPGVV